MACASVSVDDISLRVDTEVSRETFLGELHDDQATVDGDGDWRTVLLNQFQKFWIGTSAVVPSVFKTKKLWQVDAGHTEGNCNEADTINT